MPRLEFCTIKIRDFKEYRGQHVLELSELGFGLQYMRGENKVDAIGSNGAGKSSIWDAFLWCLTGRTTRGMRGTDVRTWGGDEHAKVSVGFYNDEGWHWVKRSTEKNGLWLDGKLTSQDEIDRTVGLNITNIPHTILLGQKRELFFDLQPSKKLEILSETLGLDIWDVRSERAKKKAREYEDKMLEVEGVLKQMTRDLESLRETLEDQQRMSRDWEQERSQGAEARDKTLKGLKKSRETAVTEMGTHDLAYDGSETELRAVRRDILKKQEDMDAILDRLSKARAKRDAARADLERLKELASSDTCPTCGQKVADKTKHAAHAKAALKDAKHKAAIASDRVIVRETEKELLRDVIVRMRDSEKDFANKSDDAKDKLDHLKAHIADIDKQIAVLKAKDRSEETNPYEETIRKTRTLIKNAKTGINEAKDLLAIMSRRHVRTKYWVDGFKQVRLYLLQELLMELQEVTQNILPDVGLAGWIVEYDIEREKKDGSLSTGLSVKIMKPGTDKAIKWEAWSGGENQRLLIVGALALSEVLLRHAGIECDLLVLDEPTRHMSREGVSDLVEHLIEIGREKQIWYCDHQVVESNRFANVVTITKDGHGSQISIA